MALNFPKLPGLGGGVADAKSRVFFIVAGVIGVGVLIYALVKYLGGDDASTGPSKVANTAANVQSVPGSQLSPEYYRALSQANVQATQQAQMTGGSAVPTLVNVPGQQSGFGGTGNCTVLCGNDCTDVTNSINEMVKSGKFSQEEADKLLALAKGNVPVTQYAVTLDDLVKQGKLTPDQARQLQDCYKNQYASVLLKDSSAGMDALIKSGQLPVAVANDLLAFQKKHPTVAEYQAELERLVREGKISPAVAAQLLAQYTQQQQKELAKENAFKLQQMAQAGEVTADVAKTLTELQNKNIPVDQYAAQLDRLVKEGKLTPAAAAKLLEQYKQQKLGAVSTNATNDLVAAKEAAAVAELDDMVKSGRISRDTADQLAAMQKKNVTPEEYQRYLEQLVKEGKLSPEDAKKLLATYKGVYATRVEAKKLLALRENNASLSQCTEELKSAVTAGLVTPDQAAQLVKECRPTAVPVGITPSVEGNLPGAADFAKLQQQIAAQQVQQPPPIEVQKEEFAEADDKAKMEALQARQQRILDMQMAMSNQAQQLVTAWQPVTMLHVAGSPPADKGKGGTGSSAESGTGKGGSETTTTTTTTTGRPMIKAGTILFAVLETEANSDYPDSPVMATIVQGPLKGAKLLGKLQSNLGPNQDRISLTFTAMSMDAWPTNKPINAFAIDPDTARTVLASDIDHHYAMRYGAMMATSFLSGYASAITQAGSTSTTGVFGTTTTHPQLSPASKLAVGLGQIGTNLNSVVQAYTNIPLTVKVNAGVGLGILFMSDVAQ